MDSQKVIKTIDDLIDLTRRQQAAIDKLQQQANLLGECLFLLDETLDAATNNETTIGEIYALRDKFNGILTKNMGDNDAALRN